MALLALTVTVDVVCPFSHLGCARLFEALQLEGLAASELAFGFEPASSFDAQRSSTNVGGPSARYGDPSVLLRRVARVALRRGAPVREGVSSHRAHAVLTKFQDPELLELVFEAHFERGRDISSMGELCELAEKRGIARRDVLELLEDPEHAADVRAWAARNADLQTPRVRIGSEAAFVGVQSVDTYRRALAHGRRA